MTVSAIKADVGGYVGHGDVHPNLLSEALSHVRDAIAGELLIDARVGARGDDVNLVMTHDRGVDAEEIHGFAWETFVAMTQVAKRLHLYGAGQDLLADAFSGNIRGAGKSEPGAWNFPLYKILCDPFNTAGLVIDTKMHGGFTVEARANRRSRWPTTCARMGPFEPGRLPAEAMEYTTMPQVAERLAERWQPIDEAAVAARRP